MPSAAAGRPEGAAAAANRPRPAGEAWGCFAVPRARARGDAARFNALYAEYELAPEVTRERLYLDTMEAVMSNSTKVMVDVEGGNNLLYLPLDKLINQTQNNSNSGYSTSVVPNTQSTNDNNRRSANRRDR